PSLSHAARRPHRPTPTPVSPIPPPLHSLPTLRSSDLHLSRTHIIPISILLTRNLSHHLRRRRIPRIRLLHHRELHRVLSSITRHISSTHVCHIVTHLRHTHPPPRRPKLTPIKAILHRL